MNAQINEPQNHLKSRPEKSFVRIASSGAAFAFSLPSLLGHVYFPTRYLKE
jgi:hypothetical protein